MPGHNCNADDPHLAPMLAWRRFSSVELETLPAHYLMYGYTRRECRDRARRMFGSGRLGVHIREGTVGPLSWLPLVQSVSGCD